jgi:hypothetical protein
MITLLVPVPVKVRVPLLNAGLPSRVRPKFVNRMPRADAVVVIEIARSPVVGAAIIWGLTRLGL